MVAKEVVSTVACPCSVCATSKAPLRFVPSEKGQRFHPTCASRIRKEAVKEAAGVRQALVAGRRPVATSLAAKLKGIAL